MKEIKELYNDIDNCIIELVSSRLNGDKQLEQNALTQMESLIVQTKQLLTYFIENKDFNMKKFEYLQVEYSNYPSPKELNVEGINGRELIHIHIIKKKFFDTILETYYIKEIYQATFKREVL